MHPGVKYTHCEKELTIPRKPWCVDCFLALSADTRRRPQGVRLFFDRVLAVVPALPGSYGRRYSEWSDRRLRPVLPLLQSTRRIPCHRGEDERSQVEGIRGRQIADRR